MPEVRHVFGKRLVDINARDEDDDQDGEGGATPQGSAAIHVSRLAKSGSRDAVTQQPSQMHGSLYTPLMRTSKWRCGPVDQPVDPSKAMVVPRATTWPLVSPGA